MFNSIFAPLFSSAVADVACFRDVFYHADDVAAQYSYDVCESNYGSTITQTCLRTIPKVMTLSFTPSFNYGYLCTSRILTLYVPVFIQSQLISSFTGPLVDAVKVILFRLAPTAFGIKDALRGMTPPFFLSRKDRELLCLAALKRKDKKEQEAELDYQENKLRIAAAGTTIVRIPKFWTKKKDRLPDTEEELEQKRLDAIVNRQAKLFDADKVLVAATNGLIVIMTFGMVAPLLTFVMIFSMCLQSLYLEFQVSTMVKLEGHQKRDSGKGDFQPDPNQAHEHKLPPITLRCMETLVELRRDQLALGSIMIFVLLPCICVLSTLYSVFEQPAGWVTTYAFIRGTAPSVVMLVVWNAILLYFRHLLADDGRVDDKTELGDKQNQNAAVTVASSNSVVASAKQDQDRTTTEQAQAQAQAQFDYDFDFDTNDLFLGLGELEKDAAAMNDNGVQDVEWAIQLFSGIFLGVFLWDSCGMACGVPMVVLPNVVTVVISLRSLGRKKKKKRKKVPVKMDHGQPIKEKFAQESNLSKATLKVASGPAPDTV